MMTPAFVLHLVEAGAALSLAIAAAQSLVQWRLFRPGGVLTMAPTPRGFTRGLQGYSTFLIAAVMTLASAGLFWSRLAEHAPIQKPLTLLALLALFFHLRNPHLRDGATQFTWMTLTAAALAEWAHAPLLAIVFLAAQTSLCYGTAGILKARHRSWGNGDAVRYISSSASHSNRELWQMLQHKPWHATLIGRGVTLTECALMLAPVLPPPVCLAVLCGGVLLHLGPARLFGYNQFLIAFPAAYPASYLCACLLYAR